MMHKLRFGLVGALVLAGGLLSATGTATVVRAHPWLTRGVERESLIGLRFANSYGGGLDKVTFSFTLEGCTKADLSDFRLYLQPEPAYAFYEPSAVRLDGAIMACEETGEATATSFTVTFENAAYASVTESRAQGWVYRNDRVWLTAKVNPALAAEATLRIEVLSDTLHLGGNAYDVEQGASALHRVYPYHYRISTYLPSAKALNGNFYRDATAQRVANLTELTHFEVWPLYDPAADAFTLSWTDLDGEAFAKLKAARDASHPRTASGGGARLILGLTKGANLSLASQGASAFNATALGHAAGERYRAAFVSSLVALMQEKGFDGLDIDWEYPNTLNGGSEVNNGEYEKYGLLLQDLAEAFFEHGWTLSMCTNQSGWKMPGGEVLAAADYINSMAYGPWPTFLGNAVMTQGINVCTNRGVPKRRIVVGQSIYSNANYQYGWGELATRILKAHATWPERWDCDTLWESWANANNGKSGSYINFTGPSTYRAKCNRARMEGYGGVMSWGYYSDCAWESGLSLAMHQAQAIWPHGEWPEPPCASDGVYELDSEEDWFWLQEHPAHNARLVADITFKHDPLPFEHYSHTLDGNGHTLTLPADVWLCTFGKTALFRSLSGTVRNLKVALEGRVLTRADRANDTNVNGSTLASENETALLVANLEAGAVLEQVAIAVRAGAEVQGALKTAAAVASAWCPQGAEVSLKAVHVSVEGCVRAKTENSGGTAFDRANACVGALLGWLGCPAGASMQVEACSVRLGATAQIAAETGTQSSAAGAVGDLNNLNPEVSDCACGGFQGRR